MTTLNIKKKTAKIFMESHLNDNHDELCLICHEGGIYAYNVIVWYNYNKQCTCRLNVHQNCLNKWYQYSKLCPICRKTLLRRDSKNNTENLLNKLIDNVSDTIIILYVMYFWLILTNSIIKMLYVY